MSAELAGSSSALHAPREEDWTVPRVWRILSTRELLRLFPGYALRANNVYLLRFALSRLPAERPRRLGNYELRRLNHQDLAFLLERLPSLPAPDRIRLLRRIQFFQQGFQNGFVLASSQKIAHLQWLIHPAENELIRRLWPGRYLTLADKEVLVEQAFCMPEFRGWGFHQSVTHELLKQAREAGYSQAVTYIRKDNVASLNNFLPMGFRIVRLFREWTVFGRPHMRWSGLPTT